MRKLIVQKILEFYDIPQLFVATDALGISYLCVLYNNGDEMEYLAVQLSELRLELFLKGELDLRKAYTEPEQDNTLYHVVVKDETVTANKLFQKDDVSEQMLPEAGFYYDAADAIKDSNTDSLLIDIPVSDRGFFADIAKRMGWSAKLINSATRKIAVF